MISTFNKKGLLWPLLFTLAGVFILVSLGNWQMKRRLFKAELIEKVETRLKAAPLSFREINSQALAGGDVEYQPVRLKGSFQHDREIHYFLPLGSKVGWHILTPFEEQGGDIVFVDRGFVPDAFKAQKTRLDGLPEGDVELVGLVRRFEMQGLFTPDNEVMANKWFWRDGEGLYNQLSRYQGRRLSFMVDAGRDAQTGTWPKAGVTRIQFHDKHLGYALTWYGLAMTLIGVFAAFAYQRLRVSK